VTPETGAGSDARETARLEAFSDGVLSIAITLLVLELRVPRVATQADLGHRLLELWPSYAAYFTSFATIGVIWLNHHLLFRLIARVDATLLALNGLVLLTASVLPFPTALLAGYLGQPGEKLAAIVYSATFLAITIAFNLLWLYASSPSRRKPLLRHGPDHPAVREVHRRYRLGPASSLVALCVAPFSPPAMLAITFGLVVFFALPHPVHESAS